MKISMKVIKGADTSYNGKNGRVNKYSLTCSDPEETLLDNVDISVPMESVAKFGGANAEGIKGKTLVFVIEGIREGPRRIELTGTPEIK
jgi:hypothetical protein